MLWGGEQIWLSLGTTSFLIECECAPSRGPGDRAIESQLFISSPPGSTLALGCVREGACGAKTKHEAGNVDTWTRGWCGARVIGVVACPRAEELSWAGPEALPTPVFLLQQERGPN